MSDRHPITQLTRRLTIAAALLTFAALAAFTAPRAGAVSDAEELIRFGGLGLGAGQLDLPRGVATDPVTGHVFTAEEGNYRVSEFTAWGAFVKAFGWDVAPGAVNEQQEVRVRASEGQFKLTFGASTTGDLAFDAPGSEAEGPGSVEAALNALASIGGAGGSVSVKAVSGTPDGVTPGVYVITFKGSLAGTNVDEVTASNGTTSLSGGNPTTGLEARTRADGTAGGVGLESCTEESGCQVGLPRSSAIQASGAGQIWGPSGIALDGAGNVYVREVGNARVQKFDSAGRFVLMFGGGVNKTTGEDRCTAASGDECGAGSEGGNPGQFSSSGGIASCPDGALCPGGALFLADKERIQRFNLEGELEGPQLPVPGEVVRQTAFDPLSEDLYALYDGSTVHKLDPGTGVEVGNLEGQGQVATDSAGNVYAEGPRGDGGERQDKIVQYDSSGKPLSPPTCCESPLEFRGFHLGLSGLGTNTVGDLYVANSTSGIDNFIRLFGPGPVRFEAPPKVPPTISAQFATSVERTGAVLSAEINPHFWTDTRFYVQYGEGKCSEGGCVSEKPLAPGALLAKNAIDTGVKSPGVFLEGLKPGTTYHYRFVAESLGGGPVRGVGGEVGADGEESSFTTYPAQSPFKADCPNQQFRNGFSAPLPDCRAFEMVSPIEKNNGDIRALIDLTGWKTNLEQSSTDGNGFTYSSYRAFADPKAASYTMQYLATREDGVGWSSESLDSPQGHSATGGSVDINSFENSFKAFSPDLCESWLVVAAEPVLAPGATDGYRELYRRDNCGPGGYEALIGAELALDSEAFQPELQGVSGDGGEAIFRIKEKLTPDASSGVWQTYYTSEDGLRAICVLPNGAPSGGNCSGGTGTGHLSGGDTNFGPWDFNRTASVSHAISADGSRVYWTDSAARESKPGKVYLRLNPGQEQSAISAGECTEAEKACTLKVSETVSTKASRFLGASSDGGKALFEVVEGNQAGSLYLFDAETASSTLIAAKGRGVLGTSTDLSRVYFVSEEALEGAAQAGKPNLYLSEEGTASFIATLSEAETLSEAFMQQPASFSNTAIRPVFHVARVSPDGSHLAFISTESLTGYNNTDQVTGEALSEVYLYEVGAGGPVCVSCNPGGARPRGRVLLTRNNLSGTLTAAATIPPAQFMLHYSRSLSADGQYLFFNSFDALLPRDTNGKEDVYVWQAAASEKECTKKGAELYVASSDGCLSLISSGQSSEDAEFLDASPSGEDVFFATNASLLPQDPGLIDVYDARVKGGLPGPPEPPGPCQGEACQIASPPPNDPTPASASFKGAGNLKPTPRCRKGKVARKGRCVPRKRKAAKRHAKRETNRNRGAGR